jgi:hypothetical protein
VWSFRVLRAIARPSLATAPADRPRLRRVLLRRTMEHGERIAPALIPGMMQDVRECDVLLPLLDAAAAHGATPALVVDAILGVTLPAAATSGKALA